MYIVSSPEVEHGINDRRSTVIIWFNDQTKPYTMRHILILSHTSHNNIERCPNFRVCSLFVYVYIQLGVLWGAWTSVLIIEVCAMKSITLGYYSYTH